jgi:hypothetical protein
LVAVRGLVSFACACLVAVACAAFAAPAGAEPAAGVINGSNLLVTFDTATPGAFTSQRRVTGLAAGERLVGVDYRLHPHNETKPFPGSQLFAVAVVDGSPEDLARVFTIDPATAVATAVSAEPIKLIDDGDDYGMDFNPTADRIRLVNDKDANVRLNPNNGTLAGKDNPLNPAGEGVTGIAYDRIDIQIPPTVISNTTAYAIATTSSSLVTIGSLNQTPVSPNTGMLLNAKPLGLTVASGSAAGFDITAAGTAYASLVDGGTGQPGLYTINLATGAAMLIGALPEALSGFSIVPGSAPVPPDTDPPGIALKGFKSSMSFAAFLRGVSVKVTPSEPAKLAGALLATAKSAQLSSFNLTLATKSLKLGKGQRTLKLKPGKRLLGHPKKKFKVQLRVTATDAAGNERTVTKTIKVKPPKPKR